MCDKIAFKNVDKLLDNFSRTKNASNISEHKINIDNDDTLCEECNISDLCPSKI